MEFDYFYNRDGERFSYYMLPKILVTDEMFKNLSSDAKILYSCLLERTSLPFKNKWLDEENRVYIIFTVEEIVEVLGRSNKTAVRSLMNFIAHRMAWNFRNVFMIIIILIDPTVFFLILMFHINCNSMGYVIIFGLHFDMNAGSINTVDMLNDF